MNAKCSPAPLGHVASLHLHLAESGVPLQSVESVEVVEGKGIAGDARYFGRLSRDTGQPSRRQVTLIEREQIAEHAAGLGMRAIAPGAVRSNIERPASTLLPCWAARFRLAKPYCVCMRLVIPVPRWMPFVRACARE